MRVTKLSFTRLLREYICLLTKCMIFSKSFGYALRGVLYVALSADKGPVQLNEIAEALGVPRHFMGKIMKRLAHNSILDSQKGPSGGFEINDETLSRYLIDIYTVTDHPEELRQCVLARGECNPDRPCKLHKLILPLKDPINNILYETTVGHLLQGDNEELLNGLTKNVEIGELKI